MAASVSGYRKPGKGACQRPHGTFPATGDRRLEPRHAVRVVRLLPLRLAGRVLRRAVLPARQRARRAPRQPGHVRRRLRRAAARRAGVRPHRRPASAASTPSSSPCSRWACPPRSSASCRPTRTSGIAAPVLLVTLRLVQGLALGGEYGGAATYVAEHVPDARRGYYTSFIQTTATLGFFLSLAVIGALPARGSAPRRSGAWGWRMPFLASFVLLGVSLYIRLQDAGVAAVRAAQDRGPGLEESAARRASPTRRT